MAKYKVLGQVSFGKEREWTDSNGKTHKGGSALKGEVVEFSDEKLARKLMNKKTSSGRKKPALEPIKKPTMTLRGKP